MIISKELVVSNHKKVDIVEDSRQKKFRPFPKVAKAKSAGETEDAEEGANDDAEEGANDDAEEAASGMLTDYGYLLGRAIWSLMKERVRRSHACFCVTPF